MVSLVESLNRSGPLIAAQGGARSDRHGENSLGAIEAAIALGADFVSLDVRRCRDGEFVVFRDARLARMTAATGLLSTMSSPAITRLQLRSQSGGPNASLTEDYVPLLTEVFATCRDRMPVLLRLRRWADAEPIAAAVAALGLAEQVTPCLPVSSALHAARAVALGQDYGVSVAVMASADGERGFVTADTLLSIAPVMVHMRRNGFLSAHSLRESLRAAGIPIAVEVGHEHIDEHLTAADTAERASSDWMQMTNDGARILSTTQVRRLVEWRRKRKAA